MQPDKITIERSKYGIFATARIILADGPDTVTIWAKPGHYADEYAAMSDDEIKMIAADHYNRLYRHEAATVLGSATSDRKAAASAANGRKGGRPRKPTG